MNKDEKILLILNYALRLEARASALLAFLLDVDNIEESKSFGNRTSSLSFNQKITILLDSNCIKQEDKFKLECFMAVRNQFMHNLKIKSFQDAFNHLEGILNKTKKVYPEEFDENIDIETSLEQSLRKMYSDGMEAMLLNDGAAKAKIEIISNNEVYKKIYDKTIPAIEKAVQMLIENIESGDLDFRNKRELIEHIALLKKQIAVYQIIDAD